MLISSFRTRAMGPLILLATSVVCSHAASSGEAALPRPLETYADPQSGLLDTLLYRIQVEPFNAVALVIFAFAICHTFLTAKFRHMAHSAEEEHASRINARAASGDSNDDGQPDEVSFKGQLYHFLGEVEAVFGIWVLVLAAAMAYFFGWGAVTDYIGHRVNFTEPMFVVVIMAIAGTRPVLRFAEASLRRVASLGRGSVSAWWLSILVIAPVLGSFITEPAAMTIAALVMSRQFYALKPSRKLAYATLGLLFVNISVGGTLTHFAAPPILMVAGPWGWDTGFMISNFGWKAIVGIVAATSVYYMYFRRELAALETARASAGRAAVEGNDLPVPIWITCVHLAFLAYTVMTLHHPPLFIGGFLFFLAFSQATAHHQAKLELRGPLLVGFFLAGLVVHGGLQGWWIEPVLTSLAEVPLFVGATLLTALNDNAAITYLATLVPDFTDELKYAVVAGAVTGGGLTVIANAPNPAGQSILQKHFSAGVHPLGLLLGALIPTAILGCCFLFL